MLKNTWSFPWYKYFAYLFAKADLNYNSIFFLFFLIGFFCIYFLLKKPQMRRNWILLGNLVFYVWSSIGGTIILGITALIIYAAGRIIEKIYAGFDGTGMRPKEKRIAFLAYEKKARVVLALSFILVAGVWIFVKIGRLLDVSTVGISGFLKGEGIIVPLGISYYTLCMIAYILDVYWQKTEAEHNFLKLLTAMTYFPYIVQGPFVRYQKIIKQMEELPGWDYERVCRGFQLMLWGYIKKLVIADRLILLTGTIFADPQSYAGIEIALAVFLGAFQLYADFSGCMDIVRGISQVIGIELPLNFRQPFFAKSAAEFWRRWHITLGEWTKEYIFLPIAMNSSFLKKGREIKKKRGSLAGKIFSSFFPLFSVWLFTGLWHGTGWDYICWGMYWGVIIILAQVTEDFWPKFCEKLHIDTRQPWFGVWRMVRTFLIFAVGRMWTVTGMSNGFFLLWKRILTQGRLWILFDGSLFTYGMDQKDFFVAVLGLLVLIAVDLAHENSIQIRARLAASPLILRWVVYFAAIFTVLIFSVYGPGSETVNFIYGDF